jgi:hypothetical protein
MELPMTANNPLSLAALESLAALKSIIAGLAHWQGRKGQSVCLGVDATGHELAMLERLPGARRTVLECGAGLEDSVTVTVAGVEFSAQRVVDPNSPDGRALWKWLGHQKRGASNDR